MKESNEAPRIAIVCALKEEFAAVEAGLGPDYRARFELIRAGVGPISAARVATELAGRATPPRLIVSTGFCGGLVNDLEVGDVVVGSEIGNANAGSTVSLSNESERKQIAQSLATALKRNGVRAFLGKTVCSADAIATTEHKRKLGQGGATAVDMESYALASNRKGCVVFVRAVSDSVDDELPAEVGEFLDTAGNVRAGKIMRFIFKKPSNILRLMELKKRSDIAAKSLTDAWRILRDVPFD
jgi:nucleoside phosphorylase